MDAKRAIIQMMAETLLVGESANRQECPWCASRDYSFSVTRTETGVLYNCYRDTCRRANKSSGFIGTSGVHTWGNTPARGTKGSPFLGELEPLDDEDTALWDVYRLTDDSLDDCGVMYNGQKTRYMIPVKSPAGYQRGWIARVPPGSKVTPKTFTHKDRGDGPWLGWYGSPDIVRPIVVLVEDHWSAMRLQQDSAYLNGRAVALMGTHLSDEGAAEIVTVNPRRVVWALDKDATSSAYYQCRKYQLAFTCPSVVLSLYRDIKDMGDEEMTNFLGKLC